MTSSTDPQAGVIVPELLQGPWTTAIISTYGADLTFFETRLLGQLSQVPLRIILADRAQLEEKLSESARTGQRHRLANRAYITAPIRHPRAAHAKVILLLSPNSGLLVVGSGNLGYDGYAAPGELWHVYRYDDTRRVHLDEFAAARGYFDMLAARDLIDPPVAELLNTAWSHATWLPATARPGALNTNLDRSILAQLREQAIDPVDELIVHAPFHDADCAALDGLIGAFSPSKVRLLVSKSTSADPDSIARVLASHPDALIEEIHVARERAAFIHAKWVHLLHPTRETLLTGSANLSRSALLNDSASGNIEMGVVSVGARGAFDNVYAHLSRERITDASALGIAYKGDDAITADHGIAVLWSRLDGNALAVIFDRPLPTDPGLEILSHSGSVLSCTAVTVDEERVVFHLTAESLELIAGGGAVLVRLGGSEETQATWPYHVAHLRSRITRIDDYEQLHTVGAIPEQDAELYRLLEELERTLIIDRATAWKIARPGQPAPPDSSGEGPPIRLEDLDWERIRRDPRFAGYLHHGRPTSDPPTSIQVILAAIAGRLGDIGISASELVGEPDDDLAREGDFTSADDEAVEDELESEAERRKLPISTRTRMAIDRFARRYTRALDDEAFIDDLGPIPGVTNAIVFNHLIGQLVERGAISPRAAVDAQLTTWRFLWGSDSKRGITSDLDPHTADAVRTTLDESDARSTTLKTMAAIDAIASDEDDAVALREVARQVLVSPEFGMSASLLTSASGSTRGAEALLDALADVACRLTPSEVIGLVADPAGVPRSSADWKRESVRRSGRDHIAWVLEITAPVDDLTPERAWDLLERTAVAAYFAGHDVQYVRIRFKGNGVAVAFWDETSDSGALRLGDDTIDLPGVEPVWPDWYLRAIQLRKALEQRARAA